MHFKSVFTAAAFAATSFAAPTADQVVASLDDITMKLATTNDAAGRISVATILTGITPFFNTYRLAITAQQDGVLAFQQPGKVKRQACLDLTDLQGCLDGLGAVLEDPGETLPSNSDNKVRRQAATFTDAEQSQICTAFRTSGETHRNLLNTLIGKAGIVTTATPFAAPIAALIRTDEGVFDSYYFTLRDVVPTCVNDIEGTYNSVSQGFDSAAQQYV